MNINILAWFHVVSALLFSAGIHYLLLVVAGAARCQRLQPSNLSAKGIVLLFIQ